MLKPGKISPRRGVLQQGIRFGGTVLLLGWLFAKVPWERVWPVWQQLSLGAWLAAVLLTILATVVSAYKWKLILTEPGIEAPKFGFLLRIYFIGLFFNNFLPSGMGGDVMRIALTSRKIGVAPATASVITERTWAALGLVFLCFIGFFSFHQAMGRVAVVIPVLAVVVLSLTLLLLFPGWGRFFLHFLNRYPKLSEGLTGFLNVLDRYRSRPGMLTKVFCWSVVFQGIIVVMNYLLFQGMGVDVSWSSCLSLIPLISALAMVPISINGLGLREWSYVVLFTPWGVEAPVALAVSLTFFLVVMLVSLLGGFFYLRDH
ncbi:lysylphosphatidylglycerol synthase transmembrane domain-containing protein [Desulfosporosinus burensis]